MPRAVLWLEGGGGRPAMRRIPARTQVAEYTVMRDVPLVAGCNRPDVVHARLTRNSASRPLWIRLAVSGSAICCDCAATATEAGSRAVLERLDTGGGAPHDAA